MIVTGSMSNDSPRVEVSPDMECKETRDDRVRITGGAGCEGMWLQLNPSMMDERRPHELGNHRVLVRRPPSCYSFSLCQRSWPIDGGCGWGSSERTAGLSCSRSLFGKCWLKLERGSHSCIFTCSSCIVVTMRVPNVPTSGQETETRHGQRHRARIGPQSGAGKKQHRTKRRHGA